MHELKVHKWGIQKLKDIAGLTSDEELAKKLGISLSALKRIKYGGNASPHFIAGVIVNFGQMPEIYYTEEVSRLQAA